VPGREFLYFIKDNEMKIAKNTVVSIRYDLINAEGGQQLEKVEDPISYLHGGYDGIFPLVEEALHGKSVGDKVSVTLQPDDAFGEYEHELVEVEARSSFPDDVAVGMQFEGAPEESDDEDFILYTVVEVGDDEVTVDGNHPLAGKTVTFNCTVTAVRAATEEELEHGHVHDEGDVHLH
jgi:FKBP-type peptidyl-prolyl cis-trans isomerase SlyD